MVKLFVNLRNKHLVQLLESFIGSNEEDKDKGVDTKGGKNF